MTHTVQKLAALAGVSVRTLHHYDQIGLLKPSFVAENGYRYYEEKELVALQQILFFRELDFSLEKTKHILQSPQFNALAALIDQKKLLKIKKRRVEKLIKTLEETIESLEKGESMNTQTTFSALSDPTYQKYKDEVEEKWGNTTAYQQSMQRVGKMTEADLERVKEEGGKITSAIAQLMINGYTAESEEVQKKMERFYQHLHNFYDPTPAMFAGLGQMYVDDPRFTKVYEKQATGLAIFMHDAMKIYASTLQ